MWGKMGPHVGNAHAMPESTARSSTAILAGTYRHSLDEKKRVTIPARWRNEGHGESDEKTEFFAILAVEDDDLAIHLTPASEMARVREQLQTDPDLDPKARNHVMRQLFAAAFPCPLDKQGRAVLPEDFCNRLKLKSEVVLCGVGSRIEIRSPEAWDALMPADDEALSTIAKALGISTNPNPPTS